jgi:hypothetical protein
MLDTTTTHAQHLHRTAPALRAVHDCPECGESCDCDGEDLHHDQAPEDCSHICDDEMVDEDDLADDEAGA